MARLFRVPAAGLAYLKPGGAAARKKWAGLFSVSRRDSGRLPGFTLSVRGRDRSKDEQEPANAFGALSLRE